MSFFRNVAETVGAVGVMLTVMALIGRLRPVRWIWRQLVSGPLGRWSTGLIKEGATQFHADVVQPQIDGLTRKVDQVLLSQQQAISWDSDKSWVVARITALETRQRAIIENVTAALSAPTSAVADLLAQVVKALQQGHALEIDTPTEGERHHEAQ